MLQIYRPAARHSELPLATTGKPNAPMNTPGIRRILFAVDDIDGVGE
jgi:hypothetical protein